MFARILDSLPELLKLHPRMTLFVLFCVGSLAVWSLNTFAGKDQLQNVESHVSQLDIKIDRRHLEQKIHSLESEVFALERITASASARNVDYDRLSKLKSELGSAERELNRLERSVSYN